MAVESKKIIPVISMVTVYETSKLQKSELKDAMIACMLDLDVKIMDEQIFAFEREIKSVLGSTVDSKFIYSIPEFILKKILFDSKIPQELLKAFVQDKAAMKSWVPDIINNLDWDNFEQERKKIEEEQYRERKFFNENEKLSNIESRKVKYMEEIFKGLMYDPENPFSEAINSSEKENIEKKIAKDKMQFFEKLPSFYTMYTLRSKMFQENNLVIDKNDWIDTRFLSVAIPYCDIVFAEKAWTNRANQCQLSKKYETRIICKWEDLERLLEEK